MLLDTHPHGDRGEPPPLQSPEPHGRSSRRTPWPATRFTPMASASSQPSPAARASVQAVEVKVRKPKALDGQAVPAVQFSRDRTWVPPAPLTPAEGVALEVLEEAPTSEAYRLRLDAGARWKLPVDVAAMVVSGAVVSSDGGSLKARDTLPKGANVELCGDPRVGAALLLVGRSLNFTS